MSSTKGASKDFAGAVIPLLKEYDGKLNQMCERINELLTKGTDGTARKSKVGLLDRLAVEDTFINLYPPARELAEMVSQQIEHGRLDEFDRVELRLRLAEYESSLRRVQNGLRLLVPKS